MIDCFLPVPIQMLRSVIGIIRRRRINELGVSKTINRLNIQIIIIYAYNIFIEIELNQIKSNQIDNFKPIFRSFQTFFLTYVIECRNKINSCKIQNDLDNISCVNHQKKDDDTSKLLIEKSEMERNKLK